ncbi:hypothetical protein ACOMHN_017030 [Nucella lapillus]
MVTCSRKQGQTMMLLQGAALKRPDSRIMAVVLPLCSASWPGYRWLMWRAGHLQLKTRVDDDGARGQH